MAYGKYVLNALKQIMIEIKVRRSKHVNELISNNGLQRNKINLEPWKHRIMQTDEKRLHTVSDWKTNFYRIQNMPIDYV